MFPVPYVGDYPADQQCVAALDQDQGVYIELAEGVNVNEIVEGYRQWFIRRAEVVIVDYGVSDKRGLPFILIEWQECEIDQLFLDILQSADSVADYTVYGRVLEEV